MAIVKLTDESTAVLRCPPDRADIIYWHTEGAEEHSSALGLKCRATGSRVWVWDYRMGKGAPKRRMSYGSPDDGVTLSDARRRMLLDRAAIEQGADPAELKKADPDRGTGITIAQLINGYIQHELDNGAKRNGKPRRPSYIAKAKRRLTLLRREWGARDASSITPKDITKFLDGYAGRPAMQEALWTVVSILFGFAAGRGEMKDNPCRHMKPRGHSAERERFLSEDELRLVLPELKAIDYPGGHAMLLMLLTGRRADEVLRAEWSEFDLRDATWRLPGDPRERAFPNRTEGNGVAKNGMPHTLPLSPMAMDVLREVARHRTGDGGRFLFHLPGDDTKPTYNIRAALEQARKVSADATAQRREPAQRAPFTLHDLRRTAATQLEILEAPDAVVKATLNHSDKRGVTALYMRLMSDESLRLRMLGKWLDMLSAQYAELAKPPLALPAPG